MLLEIKNLTVKYGPVVALREASFQVEEKDMITLVGANGAGKSTTLRTISGLEKPAGGEIWYDGHRIDGMPAEKILPLGISQVPEGRRVFPGLSVAENLHTGAYTRKDKAEVQRDLEWIYEIFPRLRERHTQAARTLSGGEQQMLAIGRALMARPHLLLLDEPSLGLAPKIVQEIAHTLQEIQRQGVSVILVEQNAELALELAQYGYVLETGQISLEGPTSELRDNETVREAYLGV
ncbi:ABC transporter ATP-binding protein [Thiohalorhabdus methylotrophus]|uniref:High-affinity branched-chain amino acid transport ATP-binding protein n=1 Tax=Thiohalorhabdus methylotrophus TaxID=3242694 RepID=A0ABV4TV74_9GAMM